MLIIFYQIQKRCSLKTMDFYLRLKILGLVNITKIWKNHGIK